MGVAVPTLGYSSRTEAILALRAQDVPTGEIAFRLGITPSNVTALEATRARRMRSIPAAEAPMGRAVVLPEGVLSRLRRPAERRGISANQLARLIVETVVDSQLVDAVLDDGAP